MRNTTTTRLALPLCLTFILISLLGCQDTNPPHITKKGCREDFPSTKIRLLPSFTKMVLPTENQRGYIEVRLVLEDRFGDSQKALGQFRFELYRFKPAFSDPRGQRFPDQGIQLIDLRDIEQNQQHWDPITRSYFIKLDLPDMPPTLKQIVLQVTFTSDCTQRLLHRLILNTTP